MGTRLARFWEIVFLGVFGQHFHPAKTDWGREVEFAESDEFERTDGSHSRQNAFKTNSKHIATHRKANQAVWPTFDFRFLGTAFSSAVILLTSLSAILPRKYRIPSDLRSQTW